MYLVEFWFYVSGGHAGDAGATYLVPGDVEDDKEEGADEIYQECRHYSYLIRTGRSRSITVILCFRSVHTHNTGYIQTENSIHGIRTLRTNIPGN